MTKDCCIGQWSFTTYANINTDRQMEDFIKNLRSIAKGYKKDGGFESDIIVKVFREVADGLQKCNLKKTRKKKK